MAWFYLLMAGVCEMFWTVGMKYCDGFKIILPLISVITFMMLSVVFLGLATRTIPLGIAYAVWCGIGIVGVFAYSILVLKDPISVKNIIFVGMILIGIIGLKLSG